MTHLAPRLGLAIALAACLPRAAAAEPIAACAVPATGALYRTGAAGAPLACVPPVIHPLAWDQVGPRGPAGQGGEQGPGGATGPGGAPGGDGVAGHEIVSTVVTLSLDPRQAVVVACPAGKVAVGGGFDARGVDYVTLLSTAPTVSSGASAWLLVFGSANPGPVAITIYATCVVAG